MACAGNDKAGFVGIYQGDLGSDEHVQTGEFFKHETVNARQQLGGFLGPLDHAVDESAQGYGEKGGRNSLSHYIRDHQQRGMAGQGQYVVEIASEGIGIQTEPSESTA